MNQKQGMKRMATPCLNPETDGAGKNESKESSVLGKQPGRQRRREQQQKDVEDGEMLVYLGTFAKYILGRKGIAGGCGRGVNITEKHGEETAREAPNLGGDQGQQGCAQC